MDIGANMEIKHDKNMIQHDICWMDGYIWTDRNIQLIIRVNRYE